MSASNSAAVHAAGIVGGFRGSTAHKQRDIVEASKIVADAERETDIVKLFVGSWVTRQKVLPMPQDIAAAAVAEAHKAGKLVFAHPSNIAGLKVALDAGVDVLTHALDNTTGLTAEHFRQMKRQSMAMVPTLTLFDGDPQVIAEVRSYFDAGGQILFGTDVGYLADPTPTRIRTYGALWPRLARHSRGAHNKPGRPFPRVTAAWIDRTRDGR